MNAPTTRVSSAKILAGSLNQIELALKERIMTPTRFKVLIFGKVPTGR